MQNYKKFCGVYCYLKAVVGKKSNILWSDVIEYVMVMIMDMAMVTVMIMIMWIWL